VSEFWTFIDLGFHHIADPRAFDHLLFIITLCAVYQWSEWRKILMLITAFTIGHSVTLVLAGLNILKVPSSVVELLIPVTIVLTSVYNITTATSERRQQAAFSKAVSLNYAMALLFGFIHGMGFANYFRALMGGEESILTPLFSFNVGIETGQIMIVAIFFAINYGASKLLHFGRRDWNLYISGIGGGGALVLIMQSIFK
jgi:HupE / UreJ protein